MTASRVFSVALVAASISIRLAAQQPAVTALPPAWVPPVPPTYVLPPATVVRAGRLFDPRSGTLLTNQVIVIQKM